MRKDLKNGVVCQVMPTTQFKTNKISISFITEVKTVTEITQRTLLAYLLEVSSKKYPTQQVIAQELSQMYGADFGTSTTRNGNYHIMKFNFSCVNDKYLTTPENLLTKGIKFLEEIIFRPLLVDGIFEKETFQRQKENFQTYLATMQDNKKIAALLALQKEYFTNPVQQSSVLGDLQTLKPLTAQDIVACYQKMITQDQVRIVVSGDVQEDEVVEELATLPFTARENTLGSMYYQQAIKDEVVEKVEQEKLQQSKLNLAYHFPIDQGCPDFHAAIVFNALLGGDARSYLFRNIREKASLAYYISSSFDSFGQYFYIQTGIKSSDKEQVQTLIAEQFAKIIAGEIDEQLFAEIKLSLINEHLSHLDSQNYLMVKALLQPLFKKTPTTGTWMENIQKVTIADVQEVAKKIQLQAIYFLKGEEG